VYSGPLTTDAGVLFYGTLDGWFKAVDQSNGKVLYQFKAPSGIIGNPMTYVYKGKQYVAVLTGVGGWAAIGLAEGLTKGTEGLGAVGLTTLADYTNLGGTLMVSASTKLSRRYRALFPPSRTGLSPGVSPGICRRQYWLTAVLTKQFGRLNLQGVT
jgi:hypothetical protein